MMIRNASLTAVGLLLLGVTGAPAQAAPLVGPGLTDARPTATVEKAYYYRRRCWRHRGAWVCRRYAPYAYYDGWGPSYGYGPGLGFYFGGGGWGGGRGWGGGHHGGHWGHGGHHR